VGAGTGLGLSIVFGIVQKHRGSITVDSKESEGTRFTMRFPIETEC
jgi:signal transduction histidine kinase